MKIIYYSAHPLLNLSSPSGYGTHMREMIAAFEKLGHEVLPVIAGGTEPVASGEGNTAPSGIKSIIKKLIPSILWQSLKDYRLLRFDKTMEQKLAQIISEFNPDLVYERLNYLQLSGLNTCRANGVKHFYEVNSPYVQEKVTLEGNTFFKKKALKIEQQQLTQTDKFFPVTSILNQHFTDTYNLKGDSKRSVVIPNAINPDQFKFDSNKVDQLRTTLGLEKNALVVGFVGSIFKWHGVDLLIKAYAEVVGEFPASRLLIVGSGESLPELKQLSRELNIDHQVIYTGSVNHSEVPNYMTLMDVTVMAKTNWYGSPIKIFEYGFMRKAIVAPDTQSVRDVMTNNTHGLLVDPEVQEIKAALIQLLKDDALRKHLAEKFHQKVIEQHTWEQNASSVLNEYSKGVDTN